jgi:hypothetical protein
VRYCAPPARAGAVAKFADATSIDTVRGESPTAEVRGGPARCTSNENSSAVASRSLGRRERGRDNDYRSCQQYLLHVRSFEVSPRKSRRDPEIPQSRA